MVKLDHSLASVSNALNHQIGSLHVIEDGIVQLDKIMGTTTTRIFSNQLEKLEAARSAYLWLPLVTRPDWPWTGPY